MSLSNPAPSRDSSDQVNDRVSRAPAVNVLSTFVPSQPERQPGISSSSHVAQYQQPSPAGHLSPGGPPGPLPTYPQAYSAFGPLQLGLRGPDAMSQPNEVVDWSLYNDPMLLSAMGGEATMSTSYPSYTPNERQGDTAAGGVGLENGGNAGGHGDGGLYTLSEASEDSFQTLFHNSFDMWNTLGHGSLG